LSPKIQRWAWLLSQYCIDFIHIAGTENTLADFISRHTDGDEDHDQVIDQISLPVYFTTPIKDLQVPKISITPEDLVPQIKDIEESSIPKVRQCPDKLFRHIYSNKIYVPLKSRSNIIYLAHSTPTSGHRGIRRTVDRLREYFWWPSLNNDVYQHVSSCWICARKTLRTPTRTIRDVLSRPTLGELVSLDYVGPRHYYSVNYYVLVIVDHATRFMVTHCLDKPPTAKDTFDAFMNQWTQVFHLPHTVLTDNGRHFQADFKLLIAELNVKHVFTSPYTPTANAINERTHQTLESAIQAALTSARSLYSFPDHVRVATTAYNTTLNVNLKTTPYFATFGKFPPLPGVTETNQSEFTEDCRRLNLLERYYSHLLKEASLYTTAETNKHELQHDTSITKHDIVIYWLTDAEQNHHRKVSAYFNLPASYYPNWSLPHMVTEVHPAKFKLQSLVNGKERFVSASKVKKIRQGASKAFAGDNLMNLYFDLASTKGSNETQVNNLMNYVKASDCETVRQPGVKRPRVEDAGSDTSITQDIQQPTKVEPSLDGGGCDDLSVHDA